MSRVGGLGAGRLVAGLLASLLVALTGVLATSAVAGADVVDPRPLADHVVLPDDLEVLRAEDRPLGVGLDVFRQTSGAVATQWWRGTHEAVLSGPDGRVLVIYAHRFESPARARDLWLGVLRVAEDPEVALPPTVLEDQPDTFVFGAQVTTDDSTVLTEELHRVVGSDILVIINTTADVAEALPSPRSRELIALHAAAFPTDQFDLPRPGPQGSGAATRILIAVGALTGLVIIGSAIALARQRQKG